jgi:hypothetical protein
MGREPIGLRGGVEDDRERFACSTCVLLKKRPHR